MTHIINPEWANRLNVSVLAKTTGKPYEEVYNQVEILRTDICSEITLQMFHEDSKTVMR